MAAFSQLPEAASLAAANKRVSNILAKLPEAPEDKINPALLQLPAEQALAAALNKAKPKVGPAHRRRIPNRPQPACCVAGAGGWFLYRCDGHGRRPGPAQQPPGATAAVTGFVFLGGGYFLFGSEVNTPRLCG